MPCVADVLNTVYNKNCVSKIVFQLPTPASLNYV
jgi:hypothetical protein